MYVIIWCVINACMRIRCNVKVWSATACIYSIIHMLRVLVWIDVVCIIKLYMRTRSYFSVIHSSDKD